MEDKLISYETAQLAKERGFNEFYYAIYYDKDGNEWHGFSSNTKDYEDKFVKCSQSLLQHWLREIYNISVSVETGWENGHFIYEVVLWNKSNDTLLEKVFNNYEDALEYGLIEGLKLC